MTKKLIIIDGNSLLFRAYYATAYAGTENIMRTSAGLPTNAIFAFANMMTKIINDLKSEDHLFVAFDTGEKTFRHEEYEEYKAGRQKVPDELIIQFPIAREFLDALSIPHHEINGFEADDIAATLARKAEREGYIVDIYTSDQDYLQLVSPQVTIRLIRKGLSDVMAVTPETLVATFGYEPHQATDYKGLIGDASDNLKGIPGVGKITALKLLKEFGNLETILENAEGIKGKLGENIREHQDVARKSKYLATLITDIPVKNSLDFYEYKGYESAAVQAFANKYEMRQFINQLNYKAIQKPPTIEVKHIESSEDVKTVKPKALPFYIKLNDTNYYQGKAETLFFMVDHIVYVISYENAVKDKKLSDWFAAEEIVKYSYDLKRAAVILNQSGIHLNGDFCDVALITYVVDTNISNNIGALLLNYGINVNGENDGPEITLVSNLTNIYNEGLLKLEKEALKDVYLTIEKPLQKVLVKMETVGFHVDQQVLEDIGRDYKKILEDLTQKIYHLAGHEFNINSPQQVGVVLFDELGLKANKKRSTAVDVLTALKDDHPLVSLLLEYRKYQKIISTYIDGLIPFICPDGKIHSSFNQALTTTGRLSSTNPNLQNISIRNEEGKEIRKAFHAGEETLLSIDYSQIELRLLACIANATPLIEVFNHDRDIHTETALRLFPLEDPDFARRKAKAVNFGIVYGISDFGLAEQLEIGVPEARAIIKAFFEAYPEIWTFRQKIIETVQDKGYVTTITGRKRYLPQINDPNYQTREFAKRAAMNAPIQGSAADLIKLAMIKVDEFLTLNHYQTKLILQVHDELIFALHHDEEHIIKKIVEIMENVFDLPLKLKVGVSVGPTWFSAS